MRERHHMPNDIAAALKNSGLRADYNARPAYQRNTILVGLTAPKLRVRALNASSRCSPSWRRVASIWVRNIRPHANSPYPEKRILRRIARPLGVGDTPLPALFGLAEHTGSLEHAI